MPLNHSAKTRFSFQFYDDIWLMTAATKRCLMYCALSEQLITQLDSPRHVSRCCIFITHYFGYSLTASGRIHYIIFTFPSGSPISLFSEKNFDESKRGTSHKSV